MRRANSLPVLGQASGAGLYRRVPIRCHPWCLAANCGDFAHDFENRSRNPYARIPGFRDFHSAVTQGSLVIGTVANVAVAAMQGRVHFYEGYSLEEVTFPVRTFGAAGHQRP